jgi:hypothetical protein
MDRTPCPLGMAKAFLLPAAFLLLALPLAGAADNPLERVSTGPYAGTVSEGETDLHLYATGPRWCLVPPRYYVTLTHDPASDTLVLQAAGQMAVSSNGTAQVAFDADCSTQFVITVTGAAVASSASYTVRVSTGLRGDGS